MRKFDENKIKRFKEEFFNPEKTLIQMQDECRAAGFKIGKSTIGRWINLFAREKTTSIEVPVALEEKVRKMIKEYNEKNK